MMNMMNTYLCDTHYRKRQRFAHGLCVRSFTDLCPIMRKTPAVRFRLPIRGSSRGVVQRNISFVVQLPKLYGPLKPKEEPNPALTKMMHFG